MAGLIGALPWWVWPSVGLLVVVSVIAVLFLWAMEDPGQQAHRQDNWRH